LELKKKGKHYPMLASILFGVNKFISMYFLRLGFLDGKEGLILCFNSAYGIFIKYSKLWELNRNYG
jgi:(heptosyl)LPS beta-1,4-glucosyltransferase